MHRSRGRKRADHRLHSRVARGSSSAHRGCRERHPRDEVIDKETVRAQDEVGKACNPLMGR